MLFDFLVLVLEVPFYAFFRGGGGGGAPVHQRTPRCWNIPGARGRSPESSHPLHSQSRPECSRRPRRSLPGEVLTLRSQGGVAQSSGRFPLWCQAVKNRE